jgi:hypothetical protein
MLYRTWFQDDDTDLDFSIKSFIILLKFEAAEEMEFFDQIAAWCSERDISTFGSKWQNEISVFFKTEDEKTFFELAWLQ